MGLKNKGKGPLIIEGVKASCGCTTPTLTKTTYLPGEKGTLEIAFAPKGNGRQTKTLTVRCNDPERPVTILKISSTIKPFVKPDPLYLRYEEVSKGESKQLTLDLQCVDPNFEILDFGIRGTAARYFKVEQDSFRPNQLSVTFLGQRPMGTALRKCLCQNTGRSAQRNAGRKRNSVHGIGHGAREAFALRTPCSGLERPHPKSRSKKQITLTADKPFSILSASITGARRDGPTMSLNFAPVSGDGNVWQVQLTGDLVITWSALSALAVIETDLPDESQLKFRIAGMVRELGKWMLTLLCSLSAPTSRTFCSSWWTTSVGETPAFAMGRLRISPNPQLHTPHIQRLADEGMRLDHAYASGCVCTPTRASLLTGGRTRTTPHHLVDAVPRPRHQRKAPHPPRARLEEGRCPALTRFAARTTSPSGIPNHSCGKAHWGRPRHPRQRPFAAGL